MEKISTNNVLYFFVRFVAYSIAAMIIWPLLDMFFYKVVEKKEFVYSINEYIISPISFGLLLALVVTVLKIVSDKKAKSSK